MLHPNPGGLLRSGNYNQVIACRYQWKDATGLHFIRVNFGIVALIINSHLTTAQKEGFIQDAWHLSHLCGNWICCNWRHHTVEPGPVNIGRNACFNSSEPCRHNPPCLKHKKVVLNLPTSPLTPSKAIAEYTMDIEDEMDQGGEEQEVAESDTDQDTESSSSEEEIEKEEEEEEEDSEDDDDDDDE